MTAQTKPMTLSSMMSPLPMALAIVPPMTEPIDAEDERPQQADVLLARQDERGPAVR